MGTIIWKLDQYDEVYPREFAKSYEDVKVAVKREDGSSYCEKDGTPVVLTFRKKDYERILEAAYQEKLTLDEFICKGVEYYSEYVKKR